MAWKKSSAAGDLSAGFFGRIILLMQRYWIPTDGAHNTMMILHSSSLLSLFLLIQNNSPNESVMWKIMMKEESFLLVISRKCILSLPRWKMEWNATKRWEKNNLINTVPVQLRGEKLVTWGVVKKRRFLSSYKKWVCLHKIFPIRNEYKRYPYYFLCLANPQRTIFGKQDDSNFLPKKSLQLFGSCLISKESRDCQLLWGHRGSVTAAQ